MDLEEQVQAEHIMTAQAMTDQNTDEPIQAEELATEQIQEEPNQTAKTTTEPEPDKQVQIALPDLPGWALSEKSVHEIRFCQAYREQHQMKCINGRFYDIDGVVSDDIIRAEIAAMLTPFYATQISQKVRNLIETLRMVCFSEPIETAPDEIHLLNGVLKTDGTWKEEKQFCINRLRVRYEPDTVQQPERFMSFLNQLLEPEDILTLQEYLGYCLIPSTKAQSMLFLIGNGGEGKSRIGCVLREIFGDAMLEAKFQRVGNDRFFTANLVDKLICLDDDMELSALKSTADIKKLVTAEIPVDVEVKGKQSFQTQLHARFLAFGNGSPKALYDKSDGFARRLLILTTKPKPEGRQDDPFLGERLRTEKEAIFRWMFEGLQRLLRNNYRFTLSEKTRRNIRDSVADNCNAFDFLADQSAVVFGSEFSVTCSDLYGVYEWWCRDNALTALKRDSFISILKANAGKWNINYDYNVINDQGKRVRGFKGMKTVYKVRASVGV